MNTLGVSILSNKCKIEKEQINKPKLKVIDIDIYIYIDDKCKLLHIYKKEKTNTKCAVIEVTSNINKHIKDNKSRLFVGH